MPFWDIVLSSIFLRNQTQKEPLNLPVYLPKGIQVEHLLQRSYHLSVKGSNMAHREEPRTVC